MKILLRVLSNNMPNTNKFISSNCISYFHFSLQKRGLRILTLYSGLLDNIDAISEFRELIESYELQFTVLIPAHLRPTNLHSNPKKIFESRYERWIWILNYCNDERIKVVATALKDCKATEQFCTMIASLFTLVSKRIHLPDARNYTSDEIISALKSHGILTDTSLIPVVELLVNVIPIVPTGVSKALTKLRDLIKKRKNSDSNENIPLAKKNSG